MTARSGDEHVIAFDEEAFSLGLSGSYEYDTDTMRFTYSSMTTPAQLFDYDMRDPRARAAEDAGSSVRPRPGPLCDAPPDGALRTTANWCRSRSSTTATRRSTAPRLACFTATAPTASRSPPPSTPTALSLVDRGFVYAIAHIRGGKDKGYGWYEDGKRANKTNTFLDFIAAAEHLVAERYTAHDRIVAQGGSAGGMLMGAVANMAPDRFGGIIAEVPFVDVLTTMLDDTLPLTPPEWPEWGNPIVSAEDYRTIAAYSPYDNVGAHDYPPILAVAGLTDPRVTYWEPAKWVARLRDRKTATTRCCSRSTWMPAMPARPAAFRGWRRSPSTTRSR